MTHRQHWQTSVAICCISSLFAAVTALAQGPPVKPVKPRVIISTDAGGGDDDDLQSLVHYLTYADRFDTEGFISSPPGAGRVRDIHRVLNIYARDWQWMRDHADFPHANDLRPLVKQGAVAPSPPAGFSSPTQGSQWIIQCAREKNELRPLWVLVWGSITDVAQALHDAPDIAPEIRIHFIGSQNRRHDTHALEFIEREHPEVFMIHSETTFRGWYLGGDQSDDLGNAAFVSSHIAKHGELGDFFASLTAGGARPRSIKMGDTPTVAYLLDGPPEDPTAPHWGGSYIRHPDRPRWFVDDPSLKLKQGPHPGARTINQWRTDYLRDWQTRMDWCVPTPKIAGWSSFAEREPAWFRSTAAQQIADWVISHQSIHGGWAKNRGSFQFQYHGDLENLGNTIDNDATTGEIRYLGHVAQATGKSEYLNAFLAGVDYLLAAQDSRSGGWQQEYPDAADNYSNQVTFNDRAMVNVLDLLQDIALGNEPFSSLVDQSKRQSCEEAMERGIRCILNTQVVQNGSRTVWCAQHDLMSLLPCAARSYEHPTLSGQESADIVRFLMTIPEPNRDVVKAVYAAAKWFQARRIDGYELIRDSSDSYLLKKPGGMLWSRFYELGTNRPVFSNSDGTIHYALEKIDPRRRRSYRWYSNRGQSTLALFRGWSANYPEPKERVPHVAFTSRLLYPEQKGQPRTALSVRREASVANITVPTLTEFRAEHPEHRLHVILCPGGNYEYLKIRNAYTTAQQLTEMGINVTVLKHRTPGLVTRAPDSHRHPLEDLSEAVRQIKPQLKTDEQLAISGTDSGGHLALLLAVHGGENLQPDFYAIADQSSGLFSDTARANLLGQHAAQRTLSDYYKITRQATAQLRPLFVSVRKSSIRLDALKTFTRELSKRGATTSFTIADSKSSVPEALRHAITAHTK